MRQRIWWCIVGSLALPILILTGCARGPAGGAAVANRFIIRFNTLGPIRDDLFYFVAFDDNNVSADGPLPVVSAPFGNGWGAGSFTTFVRYHQGIYQVFRHTVNPDTTVTDTLIDQPLLSKPAQGGQLEFTLDMDRTFAVGATSLDVNIFATDQILVDPNLQAIKQQDGLGFPPGTDYITIRIDRNGLFDNRSGLESAGDVVFPNIDLTDFRIEVQRQ